MSTVPHDPHTSPAPPTAPMSQTMPHSADCEQTPDVEMSQEEEAALCARYEEERKESENAETVLGGDWPEGPLSAWGCVW